MNSRWPVGVLLCRRGRQRGQAVAEFLVAATFALVPMLLLVAYLGKIGDAQHRAYEGARYAVWESARTDKDAARIRREIDHRILQFPSGALDSRFDGAVGQSTLEPIYHHRSGDGDYGALLAFDGDSYNATAIDDNDPDAKRFQQRVQFARATPARIAVGRGGMTTASVAFALAPTRWLDLENLSVRAWNVMLTDSWRAVTTVAVEERVDSAILARSHFIDSALLGMTTQIAGMVGLQEWAALEPGYIEHDVVPCSRVAGGDGEDACR